MGMHTLRALLLLAALPWGTALPAQNLVANLKTTTSGQPSSGTDPFFVIGNLAIFDANGSFGSEQKLKDAAGKVLDFGNW